MRKYVPWGLVGLVGLLLFWSIRSGGAQADRANAAEAQVKVLAARGDSLERLNRRDSTSLDSVRSASTVRDSVIASERARSRQEAQAAREAGQAVANALRATLDLQQTVLLDSIEASHTAEIQAKDREIQQADSATAVVRSLLKATEQALGSERALRLNGVAENDALRSQVRALKAGRRRDRLGATAVVAVVGLTILTH